MPPATAPPPPARPPCRDRSRMPLPSPGGRSEAPNRGRSSAMTCPRCQTEYPQAARFCARCGADVRGAGTDAHHRRGSYAAHPGEPVTSFNIVTSLMPLASGSAPQTYKFAWGLGLLPPIVFAAVGVLSLALACAAFVVPVVYVLYLYDV